MEKLVDVSRTEAQQEFDDTPQMLANPEYVEQTLHALASKTYGLKIRTVAEATKEQHWRRW